MTHDPDVLVHELGTSGFTKTLFHTAPIGIESWLRIVGVAVAAFVVVEVEKWIRFGRHHDTPVTPK